MSYIERFRELSGRFQPFSREAPLLEYIRCELQPYADECFIDTFGSLIVRQKGAGKRVMVSAQVDVPTILITYIEADQSGRFLMTGKGVCRIAEGSRVRFGTSMFGTVHYDQDCSGETDLQQMRIIAESGRLQIGDKGTLTGSVSGDDRKFTGAQAGIAAGCITLIELAIMGRLFGLDLYYVFSIGSEAELISQRGVMCAAFWIKPDVGISIELVAADDGQVVPGEGPVILLRDEHAVLRSDMRKAVRTVGEQSNMQLQYTAIAESSRETALYHYQCAGAQAVALAIPVAAYGTSEECVTVRDGEQCTKLVQQLLQYLQRNA